MGVLKLADLHAPPHEHLQKGVEIRESRPEKSRAPKQELAHIRLDMSYEQYFW